MVVIGLFLQGTNDENRASMADIVAVNGNKLRKEVGKANKVTEGWKDKWKR